jgi:hypothetical protein
MRHDGMKNCKESTMLKEVGASGQISLGKKYAGQLFEMSLQPDACIVLRPVQVVPLVTSVQETQAAYGKQELPAAQTTREWADAHQTEIEQYNAWAAQREPYSQRVRRWREESMAAEKSQA